MATKNTKSHQNEETDLLLGSSRFSFVLCLFVLFVAIFPDKNLPAERPVLTTEDIFHDGTKRQIFSEPFVLLAVEVVLRTQGLSGDLLVILILLSMLIEDTVHCTVDQTRQSNRH